MKNWSKQKKVIVVIIIILLLIVVAYQMKWFGNTKTLFAMGGMIPAPKPQPMPSPSPNPGNRPGSVIVYPTVNTAYHKCDDADVLLAVHGVHGECIGKNGGTVRY